MKLIVREHVNKITEVTKKIYSVYVQSIDAYGKIPASLGLMKGDMIAFRGAGDPVRLPAGSSGKVLTADPTQPEGVRWSDAGGGAGATTLLRNASGVAITAGAILSLLPADQMSTGREATKATCYTDGKLYIAKDDAGTGQDVDCYGIPGTIAQVLVAGTCSIGDALIVSQTAGVAEVLTAGIPTVGYAMEDKASSAVGLVLVLLSENNTLRGKNTDNVSHIDGTIYAIAGGGEISAIGEVSLNVKAAKKGQRPVGVQGNSQSLSNSLTLLHGKPGEIAMGLADTSEVRIGDWLVPSSAAPGQVRNGNGYGIGYALQAKAAGAAGKIKIRLYPAMYGYSPRAWWLPDGITEDNVLAAYQFVDRETEADALININDGTKYALAKLSTELWNRETGFYIPGAGGAGLDNDQLRGQYNSLACAVFGYSGAIITGSHAIGGVEWTYRRSLELRGLGTGTVYQRTTINRTNTGTAPVYVSPTIQPAGVLGGNWLTTSEMYKDGIVVTTAEGTNYNVNTTRASVIGQAGAAGASFDVSPFYVTAAVFYKTALSADEHKEVAENIMQLGGIL